MQFATQERDFFRSAFQNLALPVIVCRDEPRYPMLYINTSAMMMLNPMHITEALQQGEAVPMLSDFLRFRGREVSEHLFSMLQNSASIESANVSVLNYAEETLQLSLSASAVQVPGGSRCVIFYLFESQEGEKLSSTEINNFLSTTFRLAYQTDDINAAINNILAYTGSFVNVDRTYIFEETGPELTSNTYEWCADGIQPEIQNLSNLPKEDYNYDAIVHGGLYITNDVAELPEVDREILQAQGIKALAILPLVDNDKPLGYVGLDDCTKNRIWSRMEIALLESVSGILLSLMVRRNATERVRRSLDILQRITDHSDNIVYVNDLETYDLVFVNKTLADSLGRRAEDLIGKKCYEVLQEGQTVPCSFCPIPRLLDEHKNPIPEGYTWEFQNTHNGRWFLLRDNIIPWLEGKLVHIESGTDITHHKAYEEQLVQYASYDTMTGTYNREWGYKLMEDMRIDPALHEHPASLVFIDLDGLKQVNDTYGHAEGDEMIRDTLAVIRACVRKSDMICRWGGDEFILALRCNVQAAEKIMGKVMDQLADHNQRSTKPYVLSFSYGITEMRGDVSSLDSVISAADELMYQQKTGKRAEDKT